MFLTFVLKFQPLFIPGAPCSVVKKNHVVDFFLFLLVIVIFYYREAKPQGFAERYPTLVTGFFFFLWYVHLPILPVIKSLFSVVVLIATLWYNFAGIS